MNIIKSFSNMIVIMIQKGIKMALSPKEVQVLTLVALGYSDKEICLKLNISYGTVRTHIDRTVLKLRAKNRSNAILIYKLTNKDWLNDYQNTLKGNEYDFLPSFKK